MAANKLTLKVLYSQIEALKEEFRKEALKLKDTIRQQDQKIEILENWIITEKSESPEKSEKLVKTKKCMTCESTFKTSSELEIHVRDHHEDHPKTVCHICGKTFVSEWRLTKHQRIHEDKFTKTCKYFKNRVHCPFEELGCKFRHEFLIKEIDDIIERTAAKDDEEEKNATKENKKKIYSSVDDHDVTEFDSMNFETSSQIGDQTLDICAEYLKGISYEKEYVGFDKTVENIVAARATTDGPERTAPARNPCGFTVPT